MKKTRFFIITDFLLLLGLAGFLFLDHITGTDRKTASGSVTVKQEIACTATPLAVQKKSPVIRVLLTDTDFESIFHDTVTVQTEEEEITWKAGELSKKVEIPEQKNGTKLLSVRRQQGIPVYQGKIEIIPEEKGLLIINELPLEEYLEAVVPSEMPSGYEMEALKAQAICARTYAWKQMQDSSLKEWGGDVDDSVNYQVYGNIAPQESTGEAVKETEGQILVQNGEPVEAYYFSTSAGVTSTDEIWGAEKAAPYLKSVRCEFDAQDPWSSWQVSVPWKTLEERAGAMIPDPGSLVDIIMEKKNQSGAVTGLKIVTENGSLMLDEEYSIREFLSPKGLVITEKDGEEVAGGTLLPSSYFEMDLIQGEELKINGKGYGHGVGMSQNGANEMAKQGYSCEEILQYFFRDVQIQDLNHSDSRS